MALHGIAGEVMWRWWRCITFHKIADFLFVPPHEAPLDVDIVSFPCKEGS
jgi:hypothetical protein